MSIKPIDEVMLEIKRRYDKRREGWRVLGGKDLRGRPDLFISDGSMLWQLKMEMVKPFQYVGYGTRVGKVDQEVIGKTMLAGNPFWFELVSPVRRDGSFIIAKGFEKYSSGSISELKGLISDKQRRLESKLSDEIGRLIYRRYPERMMYV